MSTSREMDFKKGDTSFAKLTRAGDFDTWRLRMQFYLQGIGVFSIVDGSEEAPPNPRTPVAAPTGTTPATPETEAENTTQATTVLTRTTVDRHAIKDWRDYRMRRDMAVAMIMQGLTDELAKKYRQPELLADPAALWQRIEADGRSKLRLDVHHLRMQLTEVRLEQCGSVDAYVDRFQQICGQIALAGKNVSDGERYFFMMEGLASEWENYRDVMNSQIADTDKWEALIPLILVKEAELRKKKGISPDSALYTKVSKKGGQGGRGKHDGQGKQVFSGKCDKCGKVGHKKVDCWPDESNKGKRPKWWKKKDDGKVAKEEASGKDNEKGTKQATTSHMWAMQEVVDQMLTTGAVDLSAQQAGLRNT